MLILIELRDTFEGLVGPSHQLCELRHKKVPPSRGENYCTETTPAQRELLRDGGETWRARFYLRASRHARWSMGQVTWRP